MHFAVFAGVSMIIEYEIASYYVGTYWYWNIGTTLIRTIQIELVIVLCLPVGNDGTFVIEYKPHLK